MERTAETLCEATIVSVFGYCFAETGNRDNAADLTESLMGECLKRGIALNPLKALGLSISYFDSFRSGGKEPSPYTRDQKVVLSLRFGAGLDNYETAQVMGKSFKKTYALVLESVEVFNKLNLK